MPETLAVFVGRRRERAAVDRLLDEVRLVTLTGPGGCGKTRLAGVVAADGEARFAQGVCWVDLAAVGEPNLVAAAVAEATGAHERAGHGLADTLVGHLQQRQVLVVLDNCEHLVEACADLVARVLGACPDVTVLATSREPLAVAGETTFAVSPLTLPPASARAAREVQVADAVCLFESRARQVRSDFVVTDDNAVAVAEICRRLDGIPLALELAAARVRVLSAQQLLDALSDRFELLTAGVRGALPRQRTLEASIAWSYDLLDPAQQRALARLSVFAAGFDLDAAEAVTGEAGTSALDLVTGLADRSLLQVREHGGQARYRLLESIRLYARQRLAELEDPTVVRDRHLAHVLAVSAQAGAGLAGADAEPWLSRLAADVDDVRAAMDWAVQRQRPLDALAVAEQTLPFWMARGLFIELRRRIVAAVDAPGAAAAERARGLATAAVLAAMGGDFPAGWTFAVRAVSMARRLGDDTTLVRALIFRAWCGFYSGEATGGAVGADCREAVALAEGLDDRQTLAWALTYAGAVTARGLTIGAGRAELERAISEAREGGQHVPLANACAFLSGMLVFAAELDEARAQAETILELGRSTGVQAFEPVARTVLGFAEVLQGAEHAARQQLDAARAGSHRGMQPTFEMIAQRISALAEYRFGALPAARAAAEAGLEGARATGSRWDEASTEWLLGAVALAGDRHGDARAHFERARERSREPRYPLWLGRALLGLAQCDHHDGSIEAAWEHAHEALAVAADAGDRLATVTAVEAVAGLAAGLDQPERAVRLLAAADRFRDDVAISRFPDEAARCADHHADALARLDPGDAARCRAEGRALTLDEAVAYARRGRGGRDRPRIGWASLTPTEHDVVALVVEGCTNAEIAERRFVSVNTVKTHLSRIYAKAGLAGRAELAAEAARRDR